MSELNPSPETIAIIEQIKRAFPNKNKEKLRIARSIDPWPFYKQRLEEIFEGKYWEEVISYPNIIYCLSDVDYLREISDKAYFYYLPAFLVATLLQHQWTFYSYSLEKIQSFLPKFSLEQIDVLISYLEYWVAFERSQGIYVEDFVEALEDTQLRFMLRRDELQSGAGKPDSS